MTRLRKAAALLVLSVAVAWALPAFARAGTVTTVDPAGQSFGCHWQTKDWTYRTTNQTIFWQSNHTVTFAALRPGQTIDVIFHESGGDQVADTVTITAP